MAQIRFDQNGLQALLQELQQREYSVIGPRINKGSVVLDEITMIDELPRGYIVEQEAATYRLHKTDFPGFFGITHTMGGWNRYLYPVFTTLWKAHRNQQEFKIDCSVEKNYRFALLGMRPCDLEAIKKYDRIFLQDLYQDKSYKDRREKVFIITVNCTKPSGTCFCDSMESGPKSGEGFDLAVTEIIDNGKHYFIAETGSEIAEEIIKNIPYEDAKEKEVKAAENLVLNAATQMGRTLDTDNLKEILYKSYENPHWDDVALRCLTCGNCTMVCPTCFCTTIEDYTDLTGATGQRVRKWDSCYNNEFSYIHGGSVRTSAYARYRHWIMHKLATYYDQFDTPGCVGCGRCITWCPAAIDITEEATAIRKHSITA